MFVIIAGFKSLAQKSKMVRCSAVGCSNMSSKDKGITVHHFPKEKKLRNTWLVKMKRAKWTPTPRSVLCSLHFEDSQFRITASRPLLIKGAIPTIFNHSNDESKRTRKPSAMSKYQAAVHSPRYVLYSVYVKDA